MLWAYRARKRGEHPRSHSVRPRGGNKHGPPLSAERLEKECQVDGTDEAWHLGDAVTDAVPHT